MRYAWLLVLAMMSSLGCAVKAPTAAVRGVSLGAVDAQGLTLNLAVNVTNPNAFAIPLAQADYSLSLAGARTVTGQYVPQGTLAASGDTQISVPVGIRWDDLVQAKTEVVKSGGNVPFAVSAKLSPSGSLALLGDRATVNLSYSGVVPLKDALKDPQAVLSSPAARELASLVMRGFFP